MPNFGDISQSTAKIKLLPVAENAPPPCTSGVDFDIFIVIGKSLCMSLSRLSAAKLWRHIEFSRWRPWSRKSLSGFGLGDGTGAAHVVEYQQLELLVHKNYANGLPQQSNLASSSSAAVASW